MPLDFSKNIGELLMGLGNTAGAINQGYSGQPNPVAPMMKQRQDTLDRQLMRQMQEREMGIREEQLGRQKQKDVSDKTMKLLGAIMDSAEKGAIDGPAATAIFRRLVENDPDLKGAAGDELDKITLNPKTKELELEDFTFQDGQLVIPGSTEVTRGGRYDAKGMWKEGKFVASKAGPSSREATEKKEVETQKRFEQNQTRMEENQQRLGSQFQQGQERMAGQFQQAQAGIEQRHEENLQRWQERPLEKGDRESIGAMEENLNVVKRLKSKFTPKQLKEYVGVLTNPAKRALQLVKNDPKFAEFQTLVNEAKGFAFAEGGKQLTETEKRITWGHLPVGTEFSVADYISNLDRTLERTESLINRRIELAKTSRKNVTPRTGEQQPTSSGGTRMRFDAQGNPIP